MRKLKRIIDLDKAQEKLREVVELIDQAIDGLKCEPEVAAYVVAPLTIKLDGEHGYASDDLNLDGVREMIKKETNSNGKD